MLFQTWLGRVLSTGVAGFRENEHRRDEEEDQRVALVIFQEVVYSSTTVRVARKKHAWKEVEIRKDRGKVSKLP